MSFIHKVARYIGATELTSFSGRYVHHPMYIFFGFLDILADAKQSEEALPSRNVPINLRFLLKLRPSAERGVKTYHFGANHSSPMNEIIVRVHHNELDSRHEFVQYVWEDTMYSTHSGHLSAL